MGLSPPGDDGCWSSIAVHRAWVRAAVRPGGSAQGSSSET